MDMDSAIVILELLIGLVFAFVWGFATAAVRERKGYGRNWFWFGFFLGYIPLIIACAIPARDWSEFSPDDPGAFPVKTDVSTEPEQSLFADEDYVQRTVTAGGWQCSCGRANPAYVSTCTCGLNKRQNDPVGVDYAARVAEREAQRKTVEAELQKYKMMFDAQFISREEYIAKVKEIRRSL